MGGFLRPNDNALCRIGFALKRVGEGGDSGLDAAALVNFYNSIDRDEEVFPACRDGFAKALRA